MPIQAKRDLLAACPRRSSAGEKHQEAASDDNQLFHLRCKLPCLTADMISSALKRSARYSAAAELFVIQVERFPRVEDRGPARVRFRGRQSNISPIRIKGILSSWPMLSGMPCSNQTCS